MLGWTDITSSGLIFELLSQIYSEKLIGILWMEFILKNSSESFSKNLIFKGIYSGKFNWVEITPNKYSLSGIYFEKLNWVKFVLKNSFGWNLFWKIRLSEIYFVKFDWVKFIL